MNLPIPGRCCLCHGWAPFERICPDCKFTLSMTSLVIFLVFCASIQFWI